MYTKATGLGYCLLLISSSQKNKFDLAKYNKTKSWRAEAEIQVQKKINK